MPLPSFVSMILEWIILKDFLKIQFFSMAQIFLWKNLLIILQPIETQKKFVITTTLKLLKWKQKFYTIRNLWLFTKWLQKKYYSILYKLRCFYWLIFKVMNQWHVLLQKIVRNFQDAQTFTHSKKQQSFGKFRYLIIIFTFRISRKISKEISQLPLVSASFLVIFYRDKNILIHR